MIGIFTMFVMIGLGVFIYLEVKDLPQLRYQYDTICDRFYSSCRIEIEVLNQLKGPIYLFLEIDPISQTIFPIKDSFSIDQLNGSLKIPDDNTDAEILKTDCDFALHNEDMSDVVDIESRGLNPNNVAYPCGLLPKYFPSDDFYKIEMIKDKDGELKNESYLIKSDGLITRTGDEKSPYKQTEGQENWMDISSDRFEIWMKRSSMYAPSKLWGKVDESLEPGTYYVHVQISFDVSPFNGKKFFVLNGNTGHFSTKNSYIYVFPTLLLLPLGFFNILICIRMKEHSNSNKTTKEKEEG